MQMNEIFRKECLENGAEVMRISIIDDIYPVKTFFTLRTGGVSEAPFDSLNMGYNTNDAEVNVAKNRDLVFKSACCENPVVVYPHQVHGCDIACITEDTCRGYKYENGLSDLNTLRFSETDASVTDMKGVLLTSLHADCIPVWLYDRTNHAAGLAHAGWRGTHADIAAETVRKMKEKFGSEPKDIIAVIGPGISSCCFETGREVYDAFCDILPEYADRFSRYDGNDKFHLDLKFINRILLQKAGVSDIFESGLCTCCSDDLFYSHRRDKGVTGRMCAGICLL